MSRAHRAAPAGTPRPLPYGQHSIDESDIAAVVAVLRSDRLAHGPIVGEFEAALSVAVGARAGAACSSGTAALHLALAALDVGPGDVCVVPAISFLSTATAARFCGADVVFADVDPTTGLMTGQTLAVAIAEAGGQLKAVLPVHLGGRICAMDELSQMARAAGAVIVEDACHALGGHDAAGRTVGGCALSDAAAFSFHPVKTIAAGEGGMVTTNDLALAERVRRLANHAVTKSPGMLVDRELSTDESGELNPWSYEQIELGYNYRMNEMEAALGLSQLARLSRFTDRRRSLSARYDEALASLAAVLTPVHGYPGDHVAPHLYQVRIDFRGAGVSRAALMRRLASEWIGTQVHYIPIYRQPYFRRLYGEQRLAGAEAFYDQILALPLFPAMTDGDVDRVVDALGRVLGVA